MGISARGKQTLGVILIVLLVLWAYTQAILVNADAGKSTGAKWVSYLTYPVAPVVGFVGIWGLMSKVGSE